MLTGLDEADWERIEVVIVDNGGEVSVPTVTGRLRSLRVLRLAIPFNFPRLINAGVSVSNGDFVLMLNDDVEFTGKRWLAAMMEHATVPGSGPVGAHLKYPNGSIQHCGMSPSPDGRFLHDLRGAWPDEVAARGYDKPRVAVASTGACLLVRRSLFDAVGGLDPLFVSDYNDVDFCLRAELHGKKTVVVPTSDVVHHESMTRGTGSGVRELSDWLRFRARWSNQRTGAASPELSASGGPNCEMSVQEREGPRGTDGRG